MQNVNLEIMMKMKAWWNENGDLPKSDTKEMTCYEATAFDKLLSKIDTILCK